ncbi:uncharacterized protein LOC130134369 isoform X1 [Syzygium oleosum]|uniref:uncharacterized protein LOC130134369 isoform X1 n=2 Tax=Syzygium oleosum TaxID=219896 RepID=UPI0024BBA91F|nr:uncharacterized protein LOC130134369 isoform X1 [Syzygium oleosum]
MASAEEVKRDELAGFLKVLPPVEFSCVYGSTLHPNNRDKSSMVDYILGVSDPLQWHAEFSWHVLESQTESRSLCFLDGPCWWGKTDEIGVGVHFNPFVTWNDKMLKYGVVRMHDLVEDVLKWDRFYLSGRLQKPVHILLDNLDIENVNSSNLRAAVSAALLLLPHEFSEEDLYAKICSLSYMGDLRMLFAEDRNKVKKIVQGQFSLFQSMYKPFLEEYETKNMISFSSCGGHKANICQDIDLYTTCSLVSLLPQAMRNRMGMKLGEQKRIAESGRVVRDVKISSREEAAKCMQKVLRRTVLMSSARQAVSGFLTTGGLNAVRYLGKKMAKAWKSRT